MKVLVFSCFYQKYNGSRPQMLLDFYSKKAEAYLVAADFCHDIKQYKIEDDKRLIYVHVPSYKGNLSITRIWSHISFAIQAVKVPKKYKPELCHICVPPNYAGYLLANRSQKMGIYTIVDIVDIWPQNNSSNHLINYVFEKWKEFRNRAINIADWIVFECDFYRELLKYNKFNYTINYLAKKRNSPNNANEKWSDNIIKICYLGNLGNSYDFDSLVYLCSHLNRACEVHIIGDGEIKEDLLNKFDKNRIKYVFYGYLYDELEKKKLLGMCTFGYNAFKKNIPVALSYKSIDYLMNGLPIINSSGYDLNNLLEEYKAGINFQSGRIQELVDRIEHISATEIADMHHNAERLFVDKFNDVAFEKNMNQVWKQFESSIKE